MGITTAVTAVVSTGAGLYGAHKQNKMAKSAKKKSNIIFAEQQKYMTMLNDLMANPSSVTKLPGYEFQFEQGAEAVARKMAASGFHGSGNEATELTEFGQGMAQSAYGQQVQLLAGLSGLSSGAGPQYEQLAQQGGASSFDMMSKVLASIGYTAGQYGSAGGNTGYNQGNTMTSPDGYTNNLPDWTPVMTGAGP